MAIYGVRVRSLGQTDYFAGEEIYKPGHRVVVAAEQGETMGSVVSGPLALLKGAEEKDLPRILRGANADDMAVWQKNQEFCKIAAEFCKTRIHARNLDMKLVEVETFFDRSKLIFYFTAPGRIDFRELVKDLVREYRARIELRQIGVRHETQILGAAGNCGMQCCCNRFLRKFAPVTIKMAKEQNLFLNPSKISGICGRLLCCLSYEQENYERFHAEAPKPGKRYATDRGVLKVTRADMFKNAVYVAAENNEEAEIPLAEWQSINPVCRDPETRGRTDEDEKNRYLPEE